jgi:chromosome segregation ATPase
LHSEKSSSFVTRDLSSIRQIALGSQPDAEFNYSSFAATERLQLLQVYATSQTQAVEKLEGQLNALMAKSKGEHASLLASRGREKTLREEMKERKQREANLEEEAHQLKEATRRLEHKLKEEKRGKSQPRKTAHEKGRMEKKQKRGGAKRPPESDAEEDEKSGEEQPLKKPKLDLPLLEVYGPKGTRKIDLHAEF